MLAGENGLVYQEKLEFLLHSPGYVWNRVQQKKLMKICSSCVPRAENSKEPSLGHVTVLRRLASWGTRMWPWRQMLPCSTCTPLPLPNLPVPASGRGTTHVPIELPDGPESADIATAAGQNREVVGVQGEKEAFRREFRLRKGRLISV